MPRDGALVDLQVLDAAVARGLAHQRVEAVDQLGARAVVERQGQHHAGVALGHLARPRHALLHFLRQLLLPADVLQPDVVLHQRRQLHLQIAAQQVHQEVHFALGTLPVFGGEGIQRQRGNIEARSGLDGGAHGGHTRAMSRDTRQVAALGPAAISVHDDGDVVGQPLRIEAGVDLSLFAVQPSGHLSAQSVPRIISESSIRKWGLQ